MHIVNERKMLFNQTVYLKNPAIMRNPMKRVKPDQTPGRPKIGGAYSKNPEDMAPTSIYYEETH